MGRAMPDESTTSTATRAPGVILSARATAALSRREEPSLHMLVEKMKRDYQVNFALIVLKASVQAVEVSVGGTADADLTESVRKLWWRYIGDMLKCIADGRVAFEIVWDRDASDRTIVSELIALPVKSTRLELNDEGKPSTILLTGGKQPIRIPEDKSWWLALDATAEYPHGQSRFAGAPHEVWMDRQDALRLRRLLISRYAITGYRGYAPATVLDENGQAVDGIQSLLDALNSLDAGGHAVLPGDRDAKGERMFEVTDTPKANDPGPLDESIDGMDQDQLQAFGIPPKTVMEGSEVGSFAMVAVQRMVLDAVVDDILTQVEASFNRNICDRLCAARGYAAGSVAVSHETLVKRGNQILAQAVEAIVASPELLVGLLESVDPEQLLKATSLPLAKDAASRWQSFLQNLRTKPQTELGNTPDSAGTIVAQAGEQDAMLR